MADVEMIKIPQHRVAGKPLGRHIEHDPRSRNFEADRAPAIQSVTHMAMGLPIDQGETNRVCTANALIGALNSVPDFAGGKPFKEADAMKLYEKETELEHKPYPEFDPGGTGLKVCKAAKDLGLISRYTHAFSVEHTLQALVLRPVITGINWYTSFDSPDPETGLVAISADATVRGGHEIVADQIDEPNSLVWFWNSWGKQFGLEGRFCMTFDTWGQLPAQKGDVTVPIK